MTERSDADSALIVEFIDESLDFLAEIDNLLVSLEGDPSNLGHVESIFRPIHSIKGNCGFFGFSSIQTLSHEMETLLDLTRKGTITVSQSMIDVLLEGTDELKLIFHRCRDEETEVSDQDHFDELIARVKAQATSEEFDIDAWCVAVTDRLERFKKDVCADCSGGLEEIDALIQEFKGGTEPAATSEKPETRNPWPEPVREIMLILDEPIAELLDGDAAIAVRAHLEDLHASYEQAFVKDAIAELLQNYDVFVDSVGFDSLLQEVVVEKLKELDGLDAWKLPTTGDGAKPSQSESEPDAAPNAESEAKRPATDTTRTMRISESHIDTFLSYVGELLVVGDMLDHLETSIGARSDDWHLLSEFRQANSTFAKLSDELQESIMATRKVAVSGLLQKAHRIVRDIATKSDKRIDVQVAGDATLVDKSLLDLLDASFTHMVRNAADHGIESEEAREAKGKSPEGHIDVSITDEASDIILKISDDGGGINYDAIQAKAESLGLVQSGQRLTDKEVVDFLFASGVSTAQSITDVSGRGVGLDVVKRMIDDAGGNITVMSERDKGTVFRLSLPKTISTQIMEGFLVETDSRSFVLPLSGILEARQTEIEDVTVIADQAKVVTHSGVMPIISLLDALGYAKNGHSGMEKVTVTLTSKSGPYAIAVDKLLGVRKVVFRSIEGLDDARAPAVTGAALMGDGSMALILDIEKLRGVAA
jgi:two-component system chemotaxis sensor kinase CheA